MADSVIGALRVILGLDTAAFSSGAKEAQSTLDNLAKSFKTAIAGFGIGLLAEQFASAVKGAIDQADQLGKASQKFGVPVEQLSALKYAAELADVSFESLGKGLGKLSKAMLDGVTNPAGEAAKNFKALGVSLKDNDGNIKTSGEAFLDIADKFARMEDGAAKTALAIRLFGKAGADLIPLLNAGRTGISALTDEAAKLGIVISTQTAINAEQFNDTLKRLHTASQALALQAAAALLPQLQKIADLFVSTARDGSAFQSVLSNLISDNDIQNIQRIVLGWENFVRVLTALKAFPGNVISEGLTAALETLGRVVDENKAKVDALARSFMSLGAAGAFEGMDNLNSQLAKVAAGSVKVNLGVLGAKNAIDEFIKSQQKAIAATQADAATLGAAIGVHEGLRVTMEAEAIAKANDIKLTDAQRVALKNLSDQAATAAVDLAAAKLTQDFLSPWEQYEKKIRDINQLLATEHPISAETAAKASMAAAAKMTETYGAAAATAAGNFATFFNTFAQGNATMFAIGKAFSISQAIINTYVGATKALAELGPIFGPIAAAGLVASGLAMVAKILAEKPAAKMALGGSFAIKGAGGIDSQMVPIMATPGEKVSVDQNKYGQQASAKTITLQGLKPKEYYRGDVLRDFVDNLNEAIGDGLKIKLA